MIVFAIPGLVYLADAAVEGCILFYAEKVSVAEFVPKADDGFHGVFVRGVKALWRRSPFKLQILVIVGIERVQCIGIVTNNIEDGLNLVAQIRNCVPRFDFTRYPTDIMTSRLYTNFSCV